MSTARADLRSTISADTTQFAAGMRRAGMLARNTGNAIGNGMAGASRSIATMGAAALKLPKALLAIGGALAGAAFSKGLHNAAEMGATLDDLSMRTGVAAGELMILGKAFELGGVSADKLGGTLNKMQKVIGDAANGSTSASKALAGIGLSAESLSSMSASQQLDAIGKGVMAITDPAKRAAAAMAIFGRSGGELLPLFSSAGVMEEAASSIGKQAEIMDRSAATFAIITDKLAAVGGNVRGFFVGFLEPISAATNDLLDKINGFDFTGLGARMGESLAGAIDMVRGAVDALSLGELFQFAGLKLQSAFTDAVNILARGMAAIIELFKSGELGGAFQKIGMQLRETILLAAADMMEALAPVLASFGSSVEARAENAASFLTNSADVQRALIEDLESQDNDAPPIFDRLKEEFGKASDALKMPEGDQKKMEELAARIAEAAEKYTTARKDALEKDTGEPEVFGPPAPATAPTATTSAPYEPMGPPAPKKEYEPMGPPAALKMANAGEQGKRNSAMAGGFTGLAGLAQMQIDKSSGLGPGSTNAFAQDRKRLGLKSGLSGSSLQTGELGDSRTGLAGLAQMQIDKRSGLGPGSNNAFAQDRERLGLKSGLSGSSLQTGGLGDRRKVGQQKADGENKKNLTLAEKQAASLESIENQIAASLTVN
jgi:hypothetical protein